MLLRLSIIIALVAATFTCSAQFIQKTSEKFSRADTLRGMLRPERTCFDVKHYSINLELFIKEKSISGFVEMKFEALTDFKKMQIDLYPNMSIDSIVYKSSNCHYTREFGAIFIDLPNIKKSSIDSIRVFYHGVPKIAKNAPWDGGFVWSHDNNKNPWIGVACESEGASLWWPCKDHPSDEPDSVNFTMTVPYSMTCVSNGQLVHKTALGDTRNTFEWKVTNPINIYNVTFYVGDYYLIDGEYIDFKDRKLSKKYWVIGKKFFVAKLHFKQVDGMLHAYEQYFGPFPFFDDGYSLVEAPYLGMEHQSGIAYGNNYNSGYLGGRIPADQKFDYIVIHESAHEYWGNSVSADDRADMWIHESFATYCEALYVEWINNYQKSVEYLLYQKPGISNRSPIVGPRDVAYDGWKDSDMYIKGSWMLHSLRNTVNDDQMWFKYLRALYDHFKISVTNTTEIVKFTNDYFKKDYTPFFQQFLMFNSLPILEYYVENKGGGILLYYRWKSDVEHFNMPQKIGNGTDLWRIFPETKWKRTIFKNITKENFKIDESSFLMEIQKMAAKPNI